MHIKISEIYNSSNRGIMILLNSINEDIVYTKLIQCIKYGLNVSLVCDSGTPTISDPGIKLISECHNNDIIVNSIPGSCSINTAISSSGIPSDQFIFYGYIPKDIGIKQRKIQSMKQSGMTIVC